jgi:uncharacterized protein YqjF (DUF2071 family)
MIREGRNAMVRRAIRTAFSAVDALVSVAGPVLEADPGLPADHRPWPVPREPWTMAQTWESLLFAHWAVPADTLRVLVPSSVDLDTFDGHAWLGVTPFFVSSARVRGLPSAGPLATFPELNVRTYVSVEDKPGVFFFSLDAAHALAVRAARQWYRLPYYTADASIDAVAMPVRFRSRRTERRAPAAELDVVYAPRADVFRTRPGSLEWWLTERYCLYTTGPGTRLWRAEIHHAPWPLQIADVNIRSNTMGDWLGLPLSEPPLLAHYSGRLDVRLWPLRRVSERGRLRRAA